VAGSARLIRLAIEVVEMSAARQACVVNVVVAVRRDKAVAFKLPAFAGYAPAAA
jgi:hypothetical protein